MPKYNKQNIDRKTNKPALKRTEGLTPDVLLNRAMQIRRDDDVIRSAKRTAYDIDYAIKWYIENEIQPQITANESVINVPVIFANGEKWDNVRRLGYIRDEKGMLQSPLIMLKRNSIAERDEHRTLDVNRPQSGNQIVYRQRYDERNRYEDELFPIPTNQPADSEKIYIVDIPKYVTLEYDMMIWCDFTTQLNDLIDQILPYGRFAWGNDANKFATTIGSVSFETVNTVGEDRLVRATIPLTVLGTLLSAQESRIETIRKAYSLKKVSFDVVVDVGNLNIFSTTQVPQAVLQNQQQVMSGGSVVVSGGGSNISLNAAAMLYLTALTEKQATYVNATTVTVAAYAAINPVTNTIATVNEFDIYINGQYVDKAVYTWTPTDASTQTIAFNTSVLGYSIDSTDVIIIKGRWQ
jgi:glutaredoxin